MMNRSTALLVCVCLSGCGGRISYSDISMLPEQNSAIALTGEMDPQQRWNRPPHPQSNSTFTTVDGVPYYRLGPGDLLELQIYLEMESTTFRLMIDPAGDIRLPDHLSQERIHIGGFTITQAEETLKTILSGTLRHPQASLIVETHGSSFVTLLGEVEAKSNIIGTGEGRYVLTERTTLLDFVLTHASFNAQSDITAVMVTDTRGRSGLFDLSAAMYAADRDQNPVLERGDNILVPSTAITQSRIFVLGEVTTQSMLQPRTGMTVLDAVTEAGGFAERARKKWITLVRGRGVDAELFQIPYRDILVKGDMESNITLMPGDIIHVGTSPYDTVMEFFRDSWSIMQAAVVATILVDTLKRD